MTALLKIWALRQGARSENILYGSLNDDQRRRSVKDRATLRAEFWRTAGSVAPQSQTLAGYASSSRLASRPSELSAPSPYL